MNQTPQPEVPHPQHQWAHGQQHPMQHGNQPVPAYPQPVYGQPVVQHQQHPPQMRYPQAAPGYQVAPKNAGLSLLVSFFIPGVGSMMNGEGGKGAAILIAWIVGVLLNLTLILAIIGIPLCLAMWIWGMVDGYQGAQNWNRRHGIIS